jgi:hypothetical protein
MKEDEPAATATDTGCKATAFIRADGEFEGTLTNPLVLMTPEAALYLHDDLYPMYGYDSLV